MTPSEPPHIKAATATETTDLGEFSAIAATWSVDCQGERIERGAFAATVKDWRESGRNLPVHWSHKGESENVIGSVDSTSLAERDEGLFVAGRLHLHESAVADEVWRLMKDDSAGMSFGYMVRHSRDEKGVRVLTDLDLFEVSVTPAPANPDTRIIGMKSLPTPVQIVRFEIR